MPELKKPKKKTIKLCRKLTKSSFHKFGNCSGDLNTVGDLKSNHLNYGLFKGLISNGPVITNLFARNNIDETTRYLQTFITVLFQVHSITEELQPFQSGNVFTSALYIQLLTIYQGVHITYLNCFDSLAIRLWSMDLKHLIPIPL